MRFRFRYIFATVAQGAKKWDRPKCLSLREFHTSGGRIRTSDLRVMSPTSYQTALPRDQSGSIAGELGPVKCQNAVRTPAVWLVSRWLPHPDN